MHSTHEPVWRQALRRRECKDRGHSLVWDPNPIRTVSSKSFFSRWQVRGVCRICGHAEFRQSKRRDTFQRFTREMDEHGLKLLAAARVRFVGLKEPGTKDSPPEGWIRKQESDLRLGELLAGDRYLEGWMNIAAVIPGGVVCLDVDDRDAYEHCRQIEGFMTRTLRVQTPRGQHAWFKLPPGIKLTKKLGTSGLGRGVDVLVKGAYALAPGGWVSPGFYKDPPSRNRYRVVQVPEKNQLPILPANLLALIQDPPNEPPEDDGGSGTATGQQGAGSASRSVVPINSRWAIAEIPMERVTVGQRDDALFSHASNLLADSYEAGNLPSKADILAVLHDLNSRLATPLPRKQVNGKIRTCRRWMKRLVSFGSRFGRTSHWTPAMCRRGGRTSARIQREANRPVCVRAFRMRQQGMTFQAIADSQGCCKSVAFRRTHRGRAALTAAPLMIGGGNKVTKHPSSGCTGRREAGSCRHDPVLPSTSDGCDPSRSTPGAEPSRTGGRAPPDTCLQSPARASP